MEVKTASEYLNGEWENGEIYADGSGNGKVPLKYYCQLQHYFVVTGLTWGYFTALVGGNKLYSVYVERNENFIERLIEEEALFIYHVENRIPPEIDSSEGCKEALGRLYKKPNETFSELEDDEFGEWLLLRQELKDQLEEMDAAFKEQIKPLEEQLTFAENRMKNLIGNDKGVTWQGWKVTWGERAGRKSADIKLLEEKYPDIAKEVIKQGESYRQMSIAKPKVKKNKGVSA